MQTDCGQRNHWARASAVRTASFPQCLLGSTPSSSRLFTGKHVWARAMCSEVCVEAVSPMTAGQPWQPAWYGGRNGTGGLPRTPILVH